MLVFVGVTILWLEGVFFPPNRLTSQRMAWK